MWVDLLKIIMPLLGAIVGVLGSFVVASRTSTRTYWERVQATKRERYAYVLGDISNGLYRIHCSESSRRSKVNAPPPESEHKLMEAIAFLRILGSEDIRRSIDSWTFREITWDAWQGGKRREVEDLILQDLEMLGGRKVGRWRAAKLDGGRRASFWRR